jgi:hypothetical protein
LSLIEQPPVWSKIAAHPGLKTRTGGEDLSTDVPAVSAAVRILERLAQAWPEAVAPGTVVSELRLNRSTCYNIAFPAGSEFRSPRPAVSARAVPRSKDSWL